MNFKKLLQSIVMKIHLQHKSSPKLVGAHVFS